MIKSEKLRYQRLIILLDSTMKIRDNYSELPQLGHIYWSCGKILQLWLGKFITSWSSNKGCYLICAILRTQIWMINFCRITKLEICNMNKDFVAFDFHSLIVYVGEFAELYFHVKLKHTFQRTRCIISVHEIIKSSSTFWKCEMKKVEEKMNK